MKHARGFRRSAASVAAGAMLVAGLAGCSTNGDDDTGGTATAEQSDGGGAAAPAGSDDGGDSDTDGASDAGGSDAEGPSEQASEYGPDIDLRTEAPPISAEDAVSTAEETAGQGTLHAVELDYDEQDGAWQWDVKILVDGTDHKVVVDAVSGEVVADEQESTDDQEQAIDLDDPMAYDEARDLATAEVDGPIRSWKLEYDDGMVQYQFDIGSGDDPQEVTIDAETGEATVD